LGIFVVHGADAQKPNSQNFILFPQMDLQSLGEPNTCELVGMPVKLAELLAGLPDRIPRGLSLF